MANYIYISIPIIDELVLFAEQDSEYEDAVKAMSSSILVHYFPPLSGFSVVSEQNRNNHYADYIVLRIQRRFPGDRGIVDHTVVEAKKQIDPLDASLEQLENALENSNTEFGRCWALLIRGVEFMFYEYHQYRPVNNRLLPWGPPDQLGRNTYHVRHDSETIDWMLRQMIQQATPPARP